MTTPIECAERIEAIEEKSLDDNRVVYFEQFKDKQFRQLAPEREW